MLETMTPEELIADMEKFNTQVSEMIEAIGTVCDGKDMTLVVAAMMILLPSIAEDAPDQIRIGMGISLKAIAEALLQVPEVPQGVPVH